MDLEKAKAMSASTASFGALLRQARTAAALSQEELAERAGVSARGVSDLERGIHPTPRLETVRLLADALALAICHLWRAPMRSRLEEAQARAAEIARTHRARLAQASVRMSTPSTAAKSGGKSE